MWSEFESFVKVSNKMPPLNFLGTLFQSHWLSSMIERFTYFITTVSTAVQLKTLLSYTEKKKWGKAKIASLFQMANTVTVKTCDLITLVKALSLWSLSMKFRLIISSILLTCGESMVLSSAWHSFLRVKMHFSESWTLLYVIIIFEESLVLSLHTCF